MYTPVLKPNSPSSTNANSKSIPSSSQYHIELAEILRQHDPNAVRLYDVVKHVKVFIYNSNESRWENDCFLEGNLFAYKRQQLVNNELCQTYAFIIINRERNLIQPIATNMSHHAEKLLLFYEVIKNDKPQVFSLHFSDENECRRINSFIQQVIQNIKGQQNRASTTVGELQQPNGSIPSGAIYRPQSAANSMTPPPDSFRQTPVHVAARQSALVTDSTVDPTLSLKRLLNISNPNGLVNESGLSPQPNPVNLLPPSAFGSVSNTSSSSSSLPIGAVAHSNQHTVLPTDPSKLMNREHIRHVLVHLIQTNDQFLDIIHQACLSYPTQ